MKAYDIIIWNRSNEIMIDIHSHTTYSDGSFSVKEIMIEAERV